MKMDQTKKEKRWRREGTEEEARVPSTEIKK
jgi:hypothetical protein